MKMIEKYGHGGDIWTAAEAFGRKAEELLDYSANINPLGPPPGLLSALAEALPDITRYPDPKCRSFVHKLSAFHQLGEEWFLVGNGAAECIQLAIDALEPKRVGVVYPSFSEYEAAARKAGCEIVPLYTKKEYAFLPQADELSSVCQEIDFLFIGHPNNPTGNHLSKEELRHMVRICQANNVMTAVDEAFLDFLPDGEGLSLATELYDHPNLILFRSMTKMFAIPGLRLGYAMGHPSIISRMAEKQIPWSVNHLAQTAGELLLEQQAFVERTRRLVEEERAFLIEKLTALGVQVYPSRTNYLLLYIEQMPSSLVQAQMATYGVLIRNCAMYPGLSEGYIRISVKGREENQRMIDALSQSLKHLGK